MRHIVVDRNVCAGCSICEAVCSLNHEGVVSPSLARLRIIDHFVDGHRIEANFCRQCTGAECLRVCRTKSAGAMYVDKATGAKVIDPEKCDGCQLCMQACPRYPAAAIFFDTARKVCFKCDLCGGEPLCVKFCPENALSFPAEAL
jgi:anaerobic carbon-monoxide dehydrogenase iron sulfur subunit